MCCLSLDCLAVLLLRSFAAPLLSCRLRFMLRVLLLLRLLLRLLQCLWFM